MQPTTGHSLATTLKFTELWFTRGANLSTVLIDFRAVCTTHLVTVKIKIVRRYVHLYTVKYW